MLGPNKWRLLTIVAGILLAHAIESPSRSPRILQSQPSSSRLGVTIQRILPWSNSRDTITDSRTARNLYTPYKRFSNVDNVRFIERHQGSSDWNWKTTFGAFRYAPNSLDLRRRSDDQLSHISFYEVVNSTAYPIGAEEASVSAGTTSKPVQQVSLRKPKYAYIPLRVGGSGAVKDYDTNGVTKYQQDGAGTTEPEIQSRTDTNLYQGELSQQSTDINKVVFPDTGIHSTTAVASSSLSSSSSSSEDIQGRRSGIQFTAQSPNFGSLFVPQAYQEDNPAHPNFQSPYSEELSPLAPDTPETRTTRGVTYESPPRTAITFPATNAKQPFRDEVTKFGDINGPVTTVQRQFSDFLEKQGIRTVENVYYHDDFRHPRHYFPPKSYVEYGDYPGPPRSRLIVPWKSARTPRVVFPQNENFPSGAGISSYNNNDVVFRYVPFHYFA